MKKAIALIAIFLCISYSTGCSIYNSWRGIVDRSEMGSISEGTFSTESISESTKKAITESETDQASKEGDPMGWNGVGEITDNSAYVSTPYGDLYYPVEYADLLNVDIAEDEYYSVAFSGRSSVGDVFLFILYFGRDDCGEMVGTYAEENGDTLSVTCQMCELNLDDRWSDEEKQQLEEEQSAVSAYVIENLTKIQGFTATE